MRITRQLLQAGSGIGAVLACALLLAAEPPPKVELPSATTERTYTVQSSALHIRPGASSTYLKFSGGVSVSGADFSLQADIVELDIASSEVTSGQAFSIPKLDTDPQRAVQDPGKAAAEMARELKLPDARFSSSSLKRVGASGNVRVSAKGVTLATAGLVSNDGGRSWAATGRCSVVRKDPISKDTYSLDADAVVYDTKTQRALARGKITGRLELKGKPPVVVTAEQCELDLQHNTLSVTQGLTASYGELTLSCGTLEADLKQQLIKAAEHAHLEHSGYQLVLDADKLDVALPTQELTALGHIKAVDKARGLELEAGELQADLRTKTMVATGKPLVRYQDSTFTGERITVRQDGKKTVIETDGPQEARIDLDALPPTGSE